MVLPTSLPPLVLPSFLEHLADAIHGHQAGFHFEEGGCWGMALALFDTLSDVRVWPNQHRLAFDLMVQTQGFVHAFVVVGDRMVDHRGAWSLSHQGHTVRCSPADLRGWAHRFGVPDDDVEADRTFAMEVISTARSWEAEPPISTEKDALSSIDSPRDTEGTTPAFRRPRPA